jgi:hypothetical protein
MIILMLKNHHTGGQRGIMESGVYRLNFRGLSVAECLRFGGMSRFPLALLLKVFGKKGARQWIPPDEAEEICPADELSPDALAAMEPHRDPLQRLGYSTGIYTKAIENYDENIKDVGGYLTLHEDGRKFIFLAYVLQKLGDNFKKVLTLYGGILFENGKSISVFNHKNYLDDGGRSKKIYIKNATPEKIDSWLSDQLVISGDKVLQFASVEDLKRILNEREREVFEQKIERGLFQKITDIEKAEL